MKERMRSVVLPWSPRSPLIGVVGCAALIYVAVEHYGRTLFEVGNSARPMHMSAMDAGPVVLSLVWVVVNSPQLYDAEALGQPRVVVLSAVHACLAILVPVGAYFAIREGLRTGSMHLRFYEPFSDLNNTLVAAFLAIILVGIGGRLAGSIAWVLAIFGDLYIQGSYPAVADYLPLMGHHMAHYLSIEGMNWLWLSVLLGGALFVVFYRRSLPVGFLRGDRGGA